MSYKDLCDFSHRPKNGNCVITLRGVKYFNRNLNLLEGGISFRNRPVSSIASKVYTRRLLLCIQRELDSNVGDQLAIVAQHVPSPNSDQLTVFTSIMAAVNDSEQYPKIVFVDGPGGTGKTFFYNTHLARVRLQSQIALGLASSGIAGLLLSRGGGGLRTAHSRLKVPIDINELFVCNISKQSALAQLIKRT